MTHPLPSSPAPHSRRSRRLRYVLMGMAACVMVGGVASEGFLRWRYGLGDPPVILSDPTIEYRYAPSAHYRRRGNDIDINAFSQRADEYPAAKQSRDELRVLVIGDSVVNGGAQSDQSAIATSLLQARLRKRFGPAAIVGNASAGSWGPQNFLAYVERFGLLDADVVVIVVSSHDATDEIGPLPVDERVVSPRYLLAWQEVADRLRGPEDANGSAVTAGRAEPCLEAFDALLTKVTASGAVPLVVFHYEKPEVLASNEAAGHAMLRAVCERHGVTPISLQSAYADALAAGREPYRDYIHPSDVGQQVISDAIAPAVESALGARASSSTRPATRP